MKVLGLVGSPRRGSNTDLLVSAVLCGAGASGFDVDKVYLYDLDISPCVDCRGCKKAPFQCVLSDGMKQLYAKLQSVDAIVFGTPLYWYGPSAKMKLFIDRLRPFIASGKLKGKKAMLIVPSEEGAEACCFVVGMIEFSCKYLGVKLVGKLLPQVSERAEVKQHPQVLDEAFKIGKDLN